MKHVMNWGAILGFALIGVSLIFYLLGMTESSAAQWLNYLVIAAVIYVATKVRRETSGGALSYGQGLGVGVGVAFFASIIVAFYTYIFFTMIDPDMVQQLLDRAEDRMYDQGLPEDQVEMAMEWTRKFMQPGAMAAMVILTYTIIGLVISLITSAMLKKDGDPFQSNIN